MPQLPGLQQWVLARQIAQLSLGPDLPPNKTAKVKATVSSADLDAVIGRYDMKDSKGRIVKAVLKEAGARIDSPKLD